MVAKSQAQSTMVTNRPIRSAGQRAEF